MDHWSDSMAALRADYVNAFHLPCNVIYIGAYNVVERATNTPPGNTTASFQTFISDLAIVLSGNPPTQDGLIWTIYLR